MRVWGVVGEPVGGIKQDARDARNECESMVLCSAEGWWREAGLWASEWEKKRHQGKGCLTLKNMKGAREKTQKNQKQRWVRATQKREGKFKKKRFLASLQSHRSPQNACEGANWKSGKQGIALRLA